MPRVTGDFVEQDADGQAELGSQPRDKAFRLHVYERAPRHDNAERKRWADRGRQGHPRPPIATSIASYTPRNYSDLGGAILAPADIYRIELCARGWLHIWIAPSGVRVACPIRHLMHRDTMREVIWQQARGVMCMPSEREWSRFICERLGAFGIVILPRRRLPRYHEAQEDVETSTHAL
jgi:hypothetical protein